MPREMVRFAWAGGLTVCVLLQAGCERRSRGSQTETLMNADAAAQYREADIGLDATYAKIEPRLSGEDQQRLIAAERAWSAYRDANCSAEKALYEGGSAEPLIESACMATLTKERTAELLRVYGAQLGLE